MGKYIWQINCKNKMLNNVYWFNKLLFLTETEYIFFNYIKTQNLLKDAEFSQANIVVPSPIIFSWESFSISVSMIWWTFTQVVFFHIPFQQCPLKSQRLSRIPIQNTFGLDWLSELLWFLNHSLLCHCFIWIQILWFTQLITIKNHSLVWSMNPAIILLFGS